MLHFLVFWNGDFACCNVVTEKTIVKSAETQIETHHTKPSRFRFSVKQKKDGKKYHIVQSSMFIVKTEDRCLEYPQNMPRTSLKFAQNISEIYLKHN